MRVNQKKKKKNDEEKQPGDVNMNKGNNQVCNTNMN